MTKLKPSVFVKAAKLVSEPETGEKYCCPAIGYNSKEFYFFKSIFGNGKNTDSSWWRYSEDKQLTYSHELARSIALLLCAEMARDLKKVEAIIDQEKHNKD